MLNLLRFRSVADYAADYRSNASAPARDERHTLGGTF